MSICSYCCSDSPTDFLTCCLTLSCNLCLSKHNCNSIDTLPLELKHPILKTCRRCNLSCITHKCTTCKKFYCKQCKDDIHIGKFLTHQVIEIGQLTNSFQDEIRCSRHNLKRNIVLQNTQVGCIRCSDQDGLKKSSILEQASNNNIKQQSSFFKQILYQKKQSLNHQKNMNIQKWNSLQQNIKNMFKKLSMQLQDRLQVSLQKVHHIRSTQLLIFEELLSKINIQSNTLESLKVVNINNKNKFMKLKYGSIQQFFKIIQRKKKIGQYHIGRMETESLISAIKGLVSIDKIKQQFQTQRKRSQLMDSGRKDNRRSQSRDREMSRSRVSQVNLQSGMKTRENSMSKLPITNSFQRKLTQSMIIHTQKNRLKNQVMASWKLPQQSKKNQQQNDKFKNNFLQMKQNIRKSGTHFTQRNTSRK